MLTKQTYSERESTFERNMTILQIITEFSLKKYLEHAEIARENFETYSIMPETEKEVREAAKELLKLKIAVDERGIYAEIAGTNQQIREFRKELPDEKLQEIIDEEFSKYPEFRKEIVSRLYPLPF